jgi:nucleoside-diphosphate-sugar epimerase
VTTIAVVGATGRVGCAIGDRLESTYDVVRVGRRPGEPLGALAERAISGADLVVNAAGVAHLERPTAADLDRLRQGNVELPAALARAVLAGDLGLVHVSSVKATDDVDPSPYAQSKRDGDERLRAEWSDAFATAGRSLIVVRPLALLIPPFDAGKLARLRWLRFWPAALTPALPMPVLTRNVFVDAVAESVALALGGTAPLGYSVREFGRSERGTLRDVRDAMLLSVESRT